jgi:D-glucosaminate-6-phosphate ammonia-lyase
LPRHGVGRSCKVGKEEAVGLLAALKAFEHDGIEPWKKDWQSMATTLEKDLAAIADLSVQYIENSYRPGIPGVTLSSRTRDPDFAQALATWLRDFDPPIFLDQGAMDDGVLKIATICLRPPDVPLIVGAVKSFCERKNDRNA